MTDANERFEESFERNYTAVAAYCRRRCPTPEDAEEAATEVFAIAWKRISRLPAPPEDRLWLFGVARRVVANQVRAHRRRERLAERLRSAAETRSPVTSLQAADDSPAARAFDSLPESDRELLALVAWEGLTPAEIARVLGRPPAVVSSRLWRARRRFVHVYDAARRREEPPSAVSRPRSQTT